MTDTTVRTGDEPRWHDLVLCASFIGGAEIFGLERVRVDAGTVHANTDLARAILADERYRALRVVTWPCLDALAETISWRAVRHAAQGLRALLEKGDCVLGNLRAASVALASGAAPRNDAFLHDNTHYLNVKARTLMALIGWRVRRLYVPCFHAVGRLPLRRLLQRKIRVDYFAGYRDLAIVPVPRHRLRLVNVGRIEPAKNQRLAVEIAIELLNHVDAVELLLVGTPDGKGYLETLREAATGHPGLSFRQLSVPRGEMQATLKGNDLLLHTSLIESLPLVIFEANEAGLPAFACASGGIPEVLPARCLLPPDAAAAARVVAEAMCTGSMPRVVDPRRAVQ